MWKLDLTSWKKNYKLHTNYYLFIDLQWLSKYTKINLQISQCICNIDEHVTGRWLERYSNCVSTNQWAGAINSKSITQLSRKSQSAHRTENVCDVLSLYIHFLFLIVNRNIFLFRKKCVNKKWREKFLLISRKYETNLIFYKCQP